MYGEGIGKGEVEKDGSNGKRRQEGQDMANMESNLLYIHMIICGQTQFYNMTMIVHNNESQVMFSFRGFTMEEGLNDSKCSWVLNFAKCSDQQVSCE